MNINNVDYELIYKKVINDPNHRFWNKFIKPSNYSNYSFLFLFLEYIYKKYNKIPNIIIDKLSKNNYLLVYRIISNYNVDKSVVDNFLNSNSIYLKKTIFNNHLQTSFLNIINSLIKYNKDIPSFLYKEILKNNDYIKNFLFTVISHKKLNYITDEIYKKISKNSEICFYILKILINKNMSIPNKFYNEILKNIHLLINNENEMFNYAKLLKIKIRLEENIDQKFIKIASFSKNKSIPQSIAKELLKINKELPNFLIDSILEDIYYTYNFLEYLIDNKKYDIITDKMYKIVSKNPELSHKIYKKLLENGKEIPNSLKIKN